jgi:hypothetical protein
MADIKLKHTIDTIGALYGDTSVSRSETRSRLEAVRDEVVMLLDTLDSEREKEDEALLSGE